jgi:hypothetical protein
MASMTQDEIRRVPQGELEEILVIAWEDCRDPDEPESVDFNHPSGPGFRSARTEADRRIEENARRREDAKVSLRRPAIESAQILTSRIDRLHKPQVASGYHQSERMFPAAVVGDKQVSMPLPFCQSRKRSLVC